MNTHITKPSQLITAALISIIVSWLIVRVSYSSLPPVSLFTAVWIFVLAGVDIWASLYIRRRIEKGEVGLDRTQLNPLVALRWLALGKASSLFGAILAGITIGAGCYVWPKYSVLVAAHDDTLGLALIAIASLCLSIAGMRLEKACKVPPPSNDAHIGGSSGASPLTGHSSG